MEPAVKRTQEKLWLGGLLWWSLLLQLVYGGNFFVLVFPSNKPQVLHDTLLKKKFLQPPLSFLEFEQVFPGVHPVKRPPPVWDR